MAKDYYSTLGVLPSAEQIVIRAAYRALSQIYHPDMESGDEEKMKEINEAYSTLNDPAKRKKYDDEFTSKVHQDADFGADAPSVDPLQADWDLAKEYFSGLDEIETKLKQASWKLALAYRALMLESKDWDNRQIIADKMYDDFLTAYFGENSEIKRFASRLITKGKRTALKELNQVIRVLGSPSNADLVIDKIVAKHEGCAEPASLNMMHFINQDNWPRLKSEIEKRRANLYAMTESGQDILEYAKENNRSLIVWHLGRMRARVKNS